MDKEISSTFPVRVLHVINGEFYFGAERVQDLLALGLREHGYEVTFACIKPGKFSEQRVAKDTPLHLVPMNSRFDLHCGVKLARIIREEGYSLVHTHTPRAALVGCIATLLARVPLVHHVHSPTARDTESVLRNYINTFMEKASLFGVTRLIPVSKSLTQYLKDEGFSASKIRLVANGVPTPYPLRERQVPGHEWIVGCMALFRPRKGIEILLEAIAKLRNQGRAVRLLAVGAFETPSYEEGIHALEKQLGIEDIIEWTGFTCNVNAQFERMDVFVLPSLFGEGMPMVVLEAMAMGVPVVASAVEGIPEVLEHGRTGLVVPPSSAEHLANALADLMDGCHDWQTIRTAAYENQRAHLSDHSMAEGVAKVYREVLTYA